MIQKCVALLGNRDESTHAVGEYCRKFGEVLIAHDFDSQLACRNQAERVSGLTIIAFAESETVPPITEVGLVLGFPE